jgi:fatty acid desaturase
MTKLETVREPPSFPGGPALRNIVSDDGEPWLTHRKTLQPRYWVAWAQIALSYAMLIAGVAAASWVGMRWGMTVGLLTAPLFAIWIGYWLHPLMLFGHEAAHFHLASKRATNDLLTNLFVMSPLGLDVKLYRRIHWQHHLHLGNPNDTEISYHDKPSFKFLVQAFTGVYPVKKLIEYYAALGRANASSTESDTDGEQKARWFFAMARTAVMHLAILGGLAAFGHFGAALAWAMGLVVFFPAFNMLRQILEHRAVDADANADFTEVEHGAVNRMFPRGPVSSTFGGAGFNKHLLHHWDPGISYTCFPEMESFLARTNVGPTVDAARTTYFEALRALMTDSDGK